MWFEYRLVGTGWAEAEIGDDASHATLTASYLGDALGDLLDAVWSLLEGETETRCSWQEEPGEYRWIFRRDDDAIFLRILEFPGWDRPDEQGSLVFETRQPLATIAQASALGASRNLERSGEEGYKGRWGDAFPTRTLQLIQERLDWRSWA